MIDNDDDFAPIEIPAPEPEPQPARTLYTFYGLKLRHGVDWDMLDDEVGFCLNNGQVGWNHFGAHGHHGTYLMISWEIKQVGDAVYHSGTKAVAPLYKRDEWNKQLWETARCIGAATSGDPGWYTILSED